MNFRHLASQLILAAPLTLAGAGLARAADVGPDAMMQISSGESSTAVQQQLGEPTKVTSFLFSTGSTWYYYVDAGAQASERLLQVNFDGSGKVKSTQLVAAELFDLERR